MSKNTILTILINKITFHRYECPLLCAIELKWLWTTLTMASIVTGGSPLVSWYHKRLIYRLLLGHHWQELGRDSWYGDCFGKVMGKCSVAERTVTNFCQRVKVLASVPWSYGLSATNVWDLAVNVISWQQLYGQSGLQLGVCFILYSSLLFGLLREVEFANKSPRAAT